MSKRAARNPMMSASGYETSIVRCAVAVGLVLLGIAWIVVYLKWGTTPTQVLGAAPAQADIGWMSELGLWNFAIGFGLLFAGLIVAADPRTPLGRGRGVVVGMLGCFLIGLIWILVYYFTAQSSADIPLLGDLQNWNLMVGIGFMAVGFAYATKWE